MTDIAFGTPPEEDTRPPSNASTRWAAIADRLRANKGEWAIVDRDGWKSTKHQIVNGTLVAFRPAGAFEARIEVTDEHRGNRARIWARFVGTEGANTAEVEQPATASDALAAVRQSFAHYVDPPRKKGVTDPELRNGLQLFDSALTTLERDARS